VSKPLWAESAWYTQLAILLLRRSAEGPGGALAPWVDALPREFDTPYGWSDDEVEALHYPALREAVARQREEWAKIHSGMAVGGVDCTQAELEWALHCVRSRAFSGAYEGSTYQQRVGLFGFIVLLTVLYPLLSMGSWSQALGGAVTGLIFIVARDVISPRVLELKRYVLCPLVDMLNHDGTIPSDVEYRVFTNTYAVSADAAVPAGEQVRISYGPRSNDQLLQFHGFVEKGCVHDSYILTRFLEHVDSIAGVSDSALDTLEKEGLLQALRRGIRVGNDGKCDEASVLLAERLSVALGGSKKALELLLGACRLEKQALPTSYEEDKVQLKQFGSSSKRKAAGSDRGFSPAQSSEQGPRMQTILEFRVSKKMLLERAILELEASSAA